MGLVKSLARDALSILSEHRTRAALRMKHPKALISRDVRVVGDPNRISLGEGVSIFGPSSIFVLDGGGLTSSHLEIGEQTYIGEFANIRTAGTRIKIGAHCLLAQAVTVVGSNHGTRAGSWVDDQPWSGDGVVIEDGVWIGAQSVIVAGARIGAGAVIAANSVVRGEVPPDAVMAGSPARQVGQRK